MIQNQKKNNVPVINILTGNTSTTPICTTENITAVLNEIDPDRLVASRLTKKSPRSKTTQELNLKILTVDFLYQYRENANKDLLMIYYKKSFGI